MGDIFIDMSYICAYESFMADTDILTMDPASEAFSASIKKFFSNIRAAIKAIIAKIRQRIRAVVDRLKKGAAGVGGFALDVVGTGAEKALARAHPEDYGEKRAPSKPKNYDAYLRNAFAVMVDLEKIIESTEFMTTVGSWMAHSWNIDEAESYLASIKSELEDLTDRAHATAGMCTPEIRAYLGNFDQNARTKFASSYKRIDNIVRELERDVDAEIARCEKRADEWTEQARDDLSRGRSSQFSTENAEEYRNKATEVRKRSQRAMNAMQSLLRAVNACADALFTKV